MNTHFKHHDLNQTTSSEKPHAVVIGAGFGGLAAAIRLGARGYRVTIVDKLEQAGGRASVFCQDGFTFDAGPTIITAPFCFEELWSLCGKQMKDDVTLHRMEPFYRIRFDDGEYFTCCSDPETMRNEVARFNKNDVAGYEAFLRESEALYQFGFEQMGDQPFDSVATLLQYLPKLIGHRADRSVFDQISKYVKDPRLRIALSFYPLFVGGNPLRVTSIYNLIQYLERKWGVHFAQGGTGALVAGLVGLIEGQGGTVRLSAPVEEIIVENDEASGVILEGGERINAEVVVSNADAVWVYQNLLPHHAPKRWSSKKLSKVKHSMSLFVWYFGTNRRYEDIDHHTILMSPRYEELLRDIFDRKILAEDFSLYLHRPTATDTTLAPEGCDAFYVLSPVPHLEADVDWISESEIYREKIQERLEETIMPDLRNSIVTSKIMNPLDFRDRLNAPLGAAFGPEPIFTQSAWFRPHNVSEEVKNLFLVGAGTHPGAGVPGVITSAKILDRVVPHGDQMVREYV